ncbi:MAG TPA: MBL fold metallo-hydrolase [Symbiobacteriaceae bacterium]|nr:MBL fold metallo-hydrolase [Symbiobacteriaceae bacterium]
MTNASRIRQLSPAELKAKLDAGEEIFIVDLRNRDEFATWRIEGRKPIPTINVPYFEVLEDSDADEVPEAFAQYARKHWANVLPAGKFILVVCAKGGTSLLGAEGLQTLGYNVANLEGGMNAWGNFYDFKVAATEPNLALFQVIRPARGCLSYVLAANGQAVVIDPLRHIDQYLNFAEANGLTIVAALDTHGHADHISGGPALAERLGIPYYFHPYDAIHPVDVLPATHAYTPVWADQELVFGGISIKALHIPGHTLGNIAYLVGGKYLLSGDSIFVESIARPDLGGRGDVWSPIHFKSMSRLLTLPDETVVLPGHFSHPSEGNPQGLYTGTLGALKAQNEGLQMVQAGEEPFVRYLLASLPVFPQQYIDIKRVNAGLLKPDEDKASELELGRNICALSQAYKEV